MIDIHAETLLTLSEAAKLLPDRPHPSTLHRWRLNGVHGVRLESVQIGRKRYTSQEALARFIERSTAAADRQHGTSRQAERRHERAKQELAAAGI